MLRSLFGIGPKADLPKLLAEGATILDVRTEQEFAGGHPTGAVNIPLDELLLYLHMIRKDKPVITCCHSGNRSAMAAETLKSHGFNAHNGGRWTKVQEALLMDRR